MREMSEFLQFVLIDIAAFILGEAKEEHRPLAAPKRDHGAVAAALALSGARNPLLDQAAAKISVHKSLFGAACGLDERRIGYPFPALKPRESFQLVNPHPDDPHSRTITH